MPSIRKFIAQASPQLAAPFLERYEISLSPEEWSMSSSDIANLVDQRMTGRPVGTHSRMMQEMETVEKMATEAGENAIDSVTIHDNLPSLPSRLARALWVFLNDPGGFRRAEEIIFHDGHRYGRQWTPFTGEKGRELRSDAEAQEAFKEALKVHFDSANVHLDIFERRRSRYVDNSLDAVQDDTTVELVQITIYREDRPTMEPTFVDSTFTYQSRSPVIEAAISYEPATGRTECVATQRTNREEVYRQFSITMLGASPNMEPCPQKSYDLSVLSEPVHFDVDEADRIEAVGVTMLRLKPIDASPERITIDRLADSDRNIWQIADERLGRTSLARDYQISQAQIAIKWRADGDNRLRTLRVGITHPFKSDIKEKTAIEQLVAAKYLPRWGLLVG